MGAAEHSLHYTFDVWFHLFAFFEYMPTTICFLNAPFSTYSPFDEVNKF